MPQSTSGTFHVTLRGEDGTVFTREYHGTSEDILADAEEMFPEATILDWFDPVARQQEVYERVCRSMEDEDDGIFDE